MRSHSRRPGMRTLAVSVTVIALWAGVLPQAAVAVAPTSAPSIQAPLHGETVNGNPVLRWAPVAGAVKYRVQVSTSPTFPTPHLYSPQDTPNTSATIPTDLPLGTIYWRVAATDGTSTGVGPFSDASFERVWSDAPAPLTPADGATLTYPEDPVSFSWEPLGGAKTYKVQVDDESDFVEAVEYTTNNPRFTLKDPQTVDQPFYWRVQGVSATSGLHSAWSEPRSYTIQWPDVPVLVSPANDAVTPITDVVLDWEPVEGAASYQVQISPNGDWANNVAADVVVKGTRYSPAKDGTDLRLNEPTTLDNSDYYWRVRARDAMTPKPNLGGWSEERQFRRGWPHRPVLVSPANGDLAVANPTFEWQPVPHASHYVLEVSDDINFPISSRTMQCVTSNTYYTPYALKLPTPLVAKEPGGCQPPAIPYSEVHIDIGTRYYWRVRGLDGPLNLIPPPLPVNGLWSNIGNSDTFSFVHRVDVPEPIAPLDGDTVHTPALQWQPVAGQGRYEVFIRNAAGLLEESQKTYATSYVPTKALDPAKGPFTWNVITVNAEGGPGTNDESKHQTFNLVAPAAEDKTVAPELLEPSTTQTQSFNRMPLMRWTPVENAKTYTVYYSAGTGAWTQLSPTLTPPTFAGFTYWGPLGTDPSLPPNTYQWKVRAVLQSGAVVDSAPGEFVIAPLPLTQYVGPCTAGVACIVGDTPTLKWHHVPNAGSYEVYLAADPNFTNILRRYRTVHNELTPREALMDSQAGQSYFWFVQPCLDPDAFRGCGEFNSEVHPHAFRFRKQSAPVALVAPANGTSVANEPTFAWTDYLATAQGPGVTHEARQYRIQVSTANTFATLVEEKYVDQTTYTPTKVTYPEGPLFWRVQALDGSANPLTFSATGNLTKSSPPVKPLSPASGTTVRQVPTFRWEPLKFAAKYEVEVYKDADTQFSTKNKVVSATGAQATKLTGWTPTTSLPAGTYTWRVRRLDADNRPGVWSGGGTFTIRAPAPQLATPANGAKITTDNLQFTWKSTNVAVQYRFQSSTSSSFSTLFETQLTAGPAWAPSKHYDDATYYWRVQVLDSASNVVATSATWSFSKQTPMTTQLLGKTSVALVIDPNSVKVSGTLVRKDTGKPLPNRTVYLLGRPATSTSFSRMATLTTDLLGNVNHTHTPRRFWVYQLSFPSNGVVQGASSGSHLVKYKPVMTTALTKTTVARGQKVRMKGTISPHFRGRKIFLQKRTATGRWKNVKYTTLGAPARIGVTKFGFRVPTKKANLYYYRVKFPKARKVNVGVLGMTTVLSVTP